MKVRITRYGIGGRGGVEEVAPCRLTKTQVVTTHGSGPSAFELRFYLRNGEEVGGGGIGYLNRNKADLEHEETSEEVREAHYRAEGAWRKKRDDQITERRRKQAIFRDYSDAKIILEGAEAGVIGAAHDLLEADRKDVDAEAFEVALSELLARAETRDEALKEWEKARDAYRRSEGHGGG